MSENKRLSTGIDGLDDLLGGGLLPGTLTVVVGSTGIGKTQFGLQFARAGLAQEGLPGIIFDMTARGDSQNHADYARRMFGWELATGDPEAHVELANFFAADRRRDECLHVFSARGRRVTRQDMDFEAWHDWQAELARRLNTTIAFFYGNFVRGVRRAVVDGVEPVDRPSDSVQIDLFEYIYHQILRKDGEWVARDLFREHYRENAAAVAGHAYNPQAIGCLLLYTSHETTLDGLIERSLDEGDLLANANTIIHLGKIREGMHFRRGNVREQAPRQRLPRRDHSLCHQRVWNQVGMMPGRIIAIGDIHGCLAALEAVLAAVDPARDDTIVALGDYVDRGPDARGVLETLIALAKRTQLVPLLGNHDEMMLDVCRGSTELLGDWLLFGGNATLASYGSDDPADVWPAHLEFLARCPLAFETARHFFVHANYWEDLPLDQSPREVLLWASLKQYMPGPHVSGKTAIVGHTSQKNGEVLDLGYLKCIDTWCYGDGWLTALDVETGRCWQADKRGRLRK